MQFFKEFLFVSTIVYVTTVDSIINIDDVWYTHILRTSVDVRKDQITFIRREKVKRKRCQLLNQLNCTYVISSDFDIFRT